MPMKNPLLLFMLMLIACQSKTSVQPPEAAEEKKKVIAFQQEAWNEGDIEKFMEGYWKSDSLLFIGKTIRHGWRATLERYKQTYPDREAMGLLQFDVRQLVRLSDDTFLLTGQYTLIRTSDQPSGLFTVIFKLKGGKWVIVYDHTC
jgi:hypothetical protein